MWTHSQRRRLVAALATATLLVGGGAPAQAPDGPLRTYFVGNSVTDTIRCGALTKAAEGRGRPLMWGRHMIPGASLSWIWEHPREGFREEAAGFYPEALADQPWDVLCLQPFDRHLDGDDGDLAMARNFIDLALKRSPDVQVYVYERWPRKDKGDDGSLSLDYRTKWLRKYTGRWDGTEETRDYFEQLVSTLREAYKGRAKPLLLVPVGEVLLELDERMRAGKVPGFSGVAELYMDGIHFNNVGSYVVASTFHATLQREDPKGLPPAPYNERLDPAKDHTIDGPLASSIQEAVWTVVSQHPLAGVRAAPSPCS